VLKLSTKLFIRDTDGFSEATHKTFLRKTMFTDYNRHCISVAYPIYEIATGAIIAVVHITMLGTWLQLTDHTNKTMHDNQNPMFCMGR